MKVRISAVFQSMYLHDWKIIQLKAKRVVQGFIVEPKNYNGV